MDRSLVYPGGIPLDTDLLSSNRNAMIAIGYLAQTVLGTNTIVDGLTCTPTVPASLTVTVGPGSIAQLSVVDVSAYGSIPADTTDPLVKMGINLSPVTFTLAAPLTSGQSINYLIEATLQEGDTNPVVLPYYNAANPAQPYSGPDDSGTAQNTLRTQRVQLLLKAGAPANTGSQVTPAVDNSYVGLYVISVSYGQTVINSGSIAQYGNAPFLAWKLPMLRPGFASGAQTYVTSGSFTVPPGVTQVEVEVWGGGSGSYASVGGPPGIASGGGSGGGYSRKRITGLTGGQSISVAVGLGGAAGTTSGTVPTSGATSSFGSYVSAYGGQLNELATLANPQNGANSYGTPAGVGGVGGDVNIVGSAGQAGLMNQGGMGGAAPMGGWQNSGTFGLPGVFPGGGASGAGTGANQGTAYNGAAGANGLVVVRW